ncbi:hypothetical protein F4781DRAFT_419280 [Annulohypoxylon bovei var. microspora]|nr:hypothetical protein F4781DRAFT_419280 [Annulohypoxylon bovei var. microspora]
MGGTQVVLGSPELLDMILRRIPSDHLLASCQRVSHFWRAVILRTPILRQHAFLDSSPSPIPPICPVAECYVKNELVAFCIPTLLEWMAGRSQWGEMHVAQPNITHLRWEVTRDDRHRNIDLLDVLPCAVAELQFPRGLRMGELWDLVTSMRGVLKPVWPIERKDLLSELAGHAPAYHLFHTLILQQFVTDEDLWLGDVPEGVEVDDEEYPNQYSLYSGLPLDILFDGHQIPVPKLSVLEDAGNGTAVPVYNLVYGGKEWYFGGIGVCVL